MILQDLIRNYILYREVIRPILTSWKESLITGSFREIASISSSELQLAKNKAKGTGGGEELGWDISDDYEVMSLTHIAGTRTITNQMIQSLSASDLFYEEQSGRSAALPSRCLHIVLMGSSSIDYAVGIGKIISESLDLDIKTEILSVTKTRNTTTGFETKQINSFLFETHEKREYLGEFSLTHEETHLQYFSERRWIS